MPGRSGPTLLDTDVRARGAVPVGAAAEQGNLAPWDGLQSFGTVDVRPEVLTVKLWGIDGKPRYTVELPYVA